VTSRPRGAIAAGCCLDAGGAEQPFTTTDSEAARAHAARERLVVLRNTYEFVQSEPVADYTGPPAVIAGD
jgi:hypothetical protein